MDHKILTSAQTRLLSLLSAESFIRENFYLTGGTALAGFYLHHRYSEDLDFFSEREVDTLPLTVFFEKQKLALWITDIDFQQSYNRNLFFLKAGKDVIKTEFTYFPFPRIEKGMTSDGMPVDSILDIAVNKVFTIYQRSHARDYIDLYCMLEQQHWTMADLIQKARIKFDWHIDPLQLGTQFLKAEEVVDLPRMVQDLPEALWRGFFHDEALKLKRDILK